MTRVAVVAALTGFLFAFLFPLGLAAWYVTDVLGVTHWPV